jgi:uncharacterized membrane protein
MRAVQRQADRSGWAIVGSGRVPASKAAGRAGQAATIRAVTGVLIACGALASMPSVQAAEQPSDAEILALVNTHCVPCHAAEPTHEAFAKPPAGIMLESVDQILRYAPRILNQVVVERAMPLGNQTGMTDEERARLGAWIESRTP